MHNLRKLSCAGLLIAFLFAASMIVVSCGFAQEPTSGNKTASPTQEAEAQFKPFFAKFKKAVRNNDVKQIASAIYFPFYVYSSKCSRTDFLRDKNQKVNFFTPYVRQQILKSGGDDFVSYANKKEIGSDPGLTLIPESSPVFELDIINAHGGPAMRLMFARSEAGYKLYCLTQ